VQVDGDGKYAKPVEDPGEAYARRHQRSEANGNGSGVKSAASVGDVPASVTQTPATRQQAAPESPAPHASDEPSCPKCGGRLWDNRLSKKNPKAPDAKCRSRSCDGVIWKWDEAIQRARTARVTRADEPEDYNNIQSREVPF
jgi:hypothetical protein